MRFYFNLFTYCFLVLLVSCINPSSDSSEAFFDSTQNTNESQQSDTSEKVVEKKIVDESVAPLASIKNAAGENRIAPYVAGGSQGATRPSATGNKDDDDDNSDSTENDDMDDSEEPPPPETNCSDSMDNDMDQLSDCEDPDCDAQPCDDGMACSTGDTCTGGSCVGNTSGCTESNCTDNIDNDMDGPIDCADPDCDGQPCDDGMACSTGDTCSGGSCVGNTSGCTESNCTDNIDNDMDGPIDCADPDCDGQPCDDGMACSTGDTCSGGSCVGNTSGCTETNCADNIDNDMDGPIDCADPDCNGLLCNDGMVCSVFDICLGAVCTGLPPCIDP